MSVSAAQRVERLAPSISDEGHVPPIDNLTEPAPEVWAEHDLSERNERRLIGDGPARLVAYRGFDLGRDPVVLVHGMTSSPAVFERLCEELHQRGRQVLVLAYDDKSTSISELSVQLGVALLRLRENYQRTPPLTIVGHSLGAFVARGALVELQRAGHRGADFTNVRFEALDAPWDGFELRVAPRIPILSKMVSKVVRFFMRLIGVTTLREIEEIEKQRAIIATPLDGVAQHTTYASQSKFWRDGVRSFEDLSANELAMLQRGLRNDRAPNGRVGLLFSAMRNDSAWPALRIAAEASTAEFAARARVLFGHVVDSHTGMIASDLVLARVLHSP